MTRVAIAIAIVAGACHPPRPKTTPDVGDRVRVERIDPYTYRTDDRVIIQVAPGCRLGSGQVVLTDGHMIVTPLWARERGTGWVSFRRGSAMQQTGDGCFVTAMYPEPWRIDQDQK